MLPFDGGGASWWISSARALHATKPAVCGETTKLRIGMAIRKLNTGESPARDLVEVDTKEIRMRRGVF